MEPSPPAPAAGFVDALAARVLDPGADATALQQACTELYAWALERHPGLPCGSTALPAGLAIAPNDAARCLLDAARTACLSRALDAAIARRRARDPGARVDVLYAGCGPFAPLALIAAARHRDAPLRITLLDAHPQSLQVARELFGRAGLDTLLGGSVCDDAARWRLPEGTARPAILVVEVMQRALAREPQLAVVANLLPQCADGADLVPARIGIELVLAPLDSLFQGDAGQPRYRLGTLLELDAAALPGLCRALQADPARLAEVSVPIPADAPHGSHAVLLTCVQGGPGHTLAESASGLTQPYPLLALGRVAPGDTLRLRYRLAPDPGFEFTRSDG